MQSKVNLLITILELVLKELVKEVILIICSKCYSFIVFEMIIVHQFILIISEIVS